MQAHVVHILGGLPLFEGVGADRLPSIAPAFSARTFERGEQMLGSGASRGRTHVIAAGTARVSRVAGDGRAISVGLVDVGDIVGALPFDEEVDEVERADALERCTVLTTDVAAFEALLRDEPSVALVVLAGMARRLRGSGRRLEGLAFHQVPARLGRVLLELSDRYGKVTATGVRLDVRITHRQLAELVGTTRETLTKVAGWLRDEDIASLERREIRIANYAALQEVAEGRRSMPGRNQRSTREEEGDAAGGAAQVWDHETADARDA